MLPKSVIGLGLLLVLAACDTPLLPDVPERRAAVLPDVLPTMNQFGPARPLPPTRSNAAIATDILDLSFAMESGREIAQMSRFEGPIAVRVTPGAPPSLVPDLDRLIGRLRNEAAIDIRRVPFEDEAANITIETLPRARMQRSVPAAACFVVPRVASWAEFRGARSGRDLDWTTLETRTRVAVFIPSDVSPQEIRDCLHEEVAQAIGPLNDLYRLHDSVFNDDNLNAVLTGFDMLVLRAYYDPAIRSGMTRPQAAAVLPDILRRLNPAGERALADLAPRTPRPWIDAIEAALGPGTRSTNRVAAAERAVSIAEEANIDDGRLAFSYFALGRLTLSRDVERSINAFLASANIYDRIAPGGIQSAHVKMQLAAFALSSGRADQALLLVNSALPAATQAQNAALLSTLLMIRAEALDDLGRPSEAQATRLDSLAWGRYGFGANAAVGARLTEVAALSP
ncbi:MAG: DUF2927 domain-containing protein [Pseudomonadota bacterium]